MDKHRRSLEFIPYPQATRSLILIIQSTSRKYILIPSLLIVKNIISALKHTYPFFPPNYHIYISGWK